jgi:flagellar hook-associated protein 3 FlgL
VTEQTIGTTVLANLQANIARISDLQNQLSSGRALNKPSDSPTGTVQAMQLRGQLAAGTQYAKNIQDTTARLGTIDGALTGAMGSIQRIRDLTLQGMSTGSNGSAQAQQALATEVGQLKQTLLELANTTYLGRPVFGGTTTSSQAYDGAGNFIGDTNPVMRRLDQNTSIQADASGPAVFGSGPSGLFQVIDSIAAKLTANPGALGTDLTALDAATAQVQTALSDVGARENRVSAMDQRTTTSMTTWQASLASVENIDLPKTIMDLQMQQVTYQAALGAAAKVIQPSLVEFLK